ncbi:putative multiple exostoses 1 [Paratrimastix pyriformis]|uniref:Multiple exostoses 1 n=1 Tax=Paratrimastix pyriformis TaxID=342808 RepID=A0ABQ8UR67_9EUKA|nr:putative multiple exostoses 1 [Paratrimastix pyriformis]
MIHTISVTGLWLNWRASSCTLNNPNCFHLEQCTNFSLYIYPPNSLPLKSFLWPPPSLHSFSRTLGHYPPGDQGALAEALEPRLRPYLTDDPRKACLKLVMMDPMEGPRVEYPRYLRQLPHWDQGRNHVVFDYYDWHWSHYGQSHAAFESDYALVFKSSPKSSGYRPGFDIPTLLHPSRIPQCQCGPGDEPDDPLTRPRPLLAFFKGVIQTSNVANLRRRLLAMHDGVDFVVEDTADPASAHQDLDPASCPPADFSAFYKEHRALSYNEGMCWSRFALVPRGYGLHIYRLAEALAAGSIPVILSDNFQLPYSDWLDWRSFSLVLPEKDTASLPALLRSITPAHEAMLREAGQRLWQTQLATPELRLRLGLEIVHERIKQAQAGLTARYVPEALLHTPERSGPDDPEI